MSFAVTFLSSEKGIFLINKLSSKCNKKKQNKKTRKDKVIQNVTELPLRHTRKQFPKHFESLV